MTRVSRAAQQLGWLVEGVCKMNGGSRSRWASVWFSEAFWNVARCRLNRSAYLAFGRGWSAARTLLAPIRFAVRPWLGRCDVNYHADIGPGLHILHGTLGVVISGRAVIGSNLVLAGGNCIGLRRPGELRVGDNVTLGINALIMGPLTIGDNAKIGANALVTRDVAANETLLAPLARTPVPSQQS